jgi:hypothetical protein
LLCFFPCIRAFFTQKTVSQAECQQTLKTRPMACRRIAKHGLPVTDCYDEDWGWEIEFEHAGFPLRLGCGNMDEEAGAGEAAAFCCFITPSRATLRPLKRLFRAVDTRPAVGRLADALDAVLRAHPQISDIEWQDEQAA